MELGSIWLGGFRFGLLDCPPGKPVPIEFTKPTPALFKRAVKRMRGHEERRLHVSFTTGFSVTLRQRASSEAVLRLVNTLTACMTACTVTNSSQWVLLMMYSFAGVLPRSKMCQQVHITTCISKWQRIILVIIVSSSQLKYFKSERTHANTLTLLISFVSSIFQWQAHRTVVPCAIFPMRDDLSGRGTVSHCGRKYRGRGVWEDDNWTNKKLRTQFARYCECADE